ncbi:T6SS immunity protein Tdi1 domain-containing protein [Enterovibrio calviensis]|uniref:T6SS immunity protein Tdi1 domain-containing protein n=1 Tax=Enterovibrio calviensis TaxID=91359 RepID=UPI003734F268
MRELECYKIIEPVSSDAIGHWIKDYPLYERIVGYSNLGHIFLFNPSQSDYAVFYPFKAAAKSYGTFNSTSEFEQEILQEEGFKHFVLNADHVREISELIGTLNEDEVYIPRPYPFLGGNENVESYEKGNVWTMLTLVSQLLADSA